MVKSNKTSVADPDPYVLGLPDPDLVVRGPDPDLVVRGPDPDLDPSFLS
jgi:hypothetical protein